MSESPQDGPNMITTVPGMEDAGTQATTVEQSSTEIISQVPGVESSPSTPETNSEEAVATTGVSKFGAAKALAKLQNQALTGPAQADLAKQAGDAFKEQFKED